MLGTNGPCWIVQACWSDPSEEDKEKFDPPYDPYWAIGHYDLVPSMTFQEPDGDTQWRIYAGRTTWRNEAFNELLASIAADEAAPTLWMSQETGAVFAPYDGGVDLFLHSDAERDELKFEFRDWLSARPDGF